MSDDIRERLAKIEQKLDDHIAREEKDLARQEGRLANIEAQQDQILSDLSQYRGWLGGVLAVTGLVVAAWKLIGEWLSG